MNSGDGSLVASNVFLVGRLARNFGFHQGSMSSFDDVSDGIDLFDFSRFPICWSCFLLSTPFDMSSDSLRL